MALFCATAVPMGGGAGRGSDAKNAQKTKGNIIMQAAAAAVERKKNKRFAPKIENKWNI